VSSGGLTSSAGRVLREVAVFVNSTLRLEREVARGLCGTTARVRAYAMERTAALRRDQFGEAHEEFILDAGMIEPGTTFWISRVAELVFSS